MAGGDLLVAAEHAALFESVAAEAVRKHDTKNAFVQKALGKIMAQGVKMDDAKTLCTEIMKCEPGLRSASFLRGVIQKVLNVGSGIENRLLSKLKSASNWPHNASTDSVLRNIQKPLT